MTNDILEKLRTVLSDGNWTEVSAVFVLTKIRKLLELADGQPTQPQLRFFCDWILHTRLDRQGAENILREFDALMEPYVARNMSDFKVQADALEGLLSWERLREELRKFLNQRKLPNSVTEDPAVWIRFLDCYIGAITDTPLVVKPLPTEYVESITITNTDPETEEQLPYVAWSVKLFAHPSPVLMPIKGLTALREKRKRP